MRREPIGVMPALVDARKLCEDDAIEDLIEMLQDEMEEEASQYRKDVDFILDATFPTRKRWRLK